MSLLAALWGASYLFIKVGLDDGLTPVFALLYGVWLLREPLTAGAVLGLLLILAGSFFAAEGRLPGQARATL